MLTSAWNSFSVSDSMNESPVYLTLINVYEDKFIYAINKEIITLIMIRYTNQ